MATSVINEPDLALDRHDGNIFVITMRKGPENRLNSAYCQKLIAAFNLVRTTLGPDSEGAVITKGNDAKFWCTVSPTNPPTSVLEEHDLKGSTQYKSRTHNKKHSAKKKNEKPVHCHFQSTIPKTPNTTHPPLAPPKTDKTFLNHRD